MKETRNEAHELEKTLPEKGTQFSVWAPNADSVAVAGTFNDWNADSHLMEKNEDGVWNLNVSEASTGDEYKYVIKNGDLTLWKNDPRGRQLTNSNGNTVLIDDSTFDWENDSDFQLRGWNELVIYEMHLGTFFRGNDQSTVGTFDDAINRLDHLVNLGINAVELMPVAEFAGDQSWGYNPAFPFAIESDYGGVDGLKRFVKACHQKGIAVIMDVVYNHFGPSDLDLWQFDGWSQDGMGGIYFYNDWRSNTPWGDTRPDYGRGEVRQYIRDNAMMWFENFHVDGLRFDMTFYVRSVSEGADIPEGWSLAQWINDEIAQHYPGALTIAEDLRTNEWITKSTGEGGAGFGSQWDEQFVHPVRSVLSEMKDENRSMPVIEKTLSYCYNGDPFQRVVYTESHDEVANGKSRVPSEIDEYEAESIWARKRSILGACLTFTAPGIPMIFQGQEFLATGHFEDGSELDWDTAPHEEGVTNVYRDLIHLRTNRGGDSSALQSPHIEITYVNDEHKIVSFTRGETDNRMFVILNFSGNSWDDYRFGIPDDGEWKLLFHSDSKVYGPDFGNIEAFDFNAESVEMHDRPYSFTTKIGSYDCLIFGRSV